MDYEIVARAFEGWALSEIRRMSVRERKFWTNRAIKILEMRQKSGTSR